MMAVAMQNNTADFLFFIAKYNNINGANIPLVNFPMIETPSHNPDLKNEF